MPVIERLLGDGSKREFLERVFLKVPFARTRGAVDFVKLGKWSTVQSILQTDHVDLMVVRDGQLVTTDPAPTYQQVRQLHDSGCTLVIRNSERHHSELEAVADGFRKDFHGVVDIHIYCTPAGHSGFGWHYDAEDVFIVQTEGSKEYSLRKNTVHPWPLVETIPQDMQYDREIMPSMQCTLAEGDWMYIPAGYWHRARAADPQNPSISLAIGVMTMAAIDVIQFIRPRLLGSLLWRQRLPIVECGEDGQVLPTILEQYREIFAQLGHDLACTLQDPQLLKEFLASRASNTAAALAPVGTNR